MFLDGRSSSEVILRIVRMLMDLSIQVPQLVLRPDFEHVCHEGFTELTRRKKANIPLCAWAHWRVQTWSSQRESSPSPAVYLVLLWMICQDDNNKNNYKSLCWKQSDCGLEMFHGTTSVLRHFHFDLIYHNFSNEHAQMVDREFIRHVFICFITLSPMVEGIIKW